jgi:hypothetical protein
MEDTRDIKMLYCKLHKYRKLGEKMLGTCIKNPYINVFGLEYHIEELFVFISNNIKKIDYSEDIFRRLNELISYDYIGFKYISGTTEYKIFYEIRKLNKLVNKITRHVKYTKGTREYQILMESDRFSYRFEYLMGMYDNIKEIISNLCIGEEQSNQIHSGILKKRNSYIKSIREEKVLPVRIGNVLRSKPGRVEVKFNCGIVKPKLSGIYVLPYDYLKKRYSNEFISVNYEQDLEILPNWKEIECNGEIVKLYKVCILKVTGEVGEILMTYRFIYNKDRYDRAHWSYPFSEGSLYATFSTFRLKSLLK